MIELQLGAKSVYSKAAVPIFPRTEEIYRLLLFVWVLLSFFHFFTEVCDIATIKYTNIKFSVQ